MTIAADALFVNPRQAQLSLRADALVIDQGGRSERRVGDRPRRRAPHRGRGQRPGRRRVRQHSPTAIIVVKTPTPRATSRRLRRPGVGRPRGRAGRRDRRVPLTFGDGAPRRLGADRRAFVPPAATSSRSPSSSTASAASEPRRHARARAAEPPRGRDHEAQGQRDGRAIGQEAAQGSKPPRAKISFAGTPKSAAGVESVVVTIEKIGTTKKACRGWTRRRAWSGRPARSPPDQRQARPGSGTTRASKIKLAKGAYRISAYGTDEAAASATRPRGAPRRALQAEVEEGQCQRTSPRVPRDEPARRAAEAGGAGANRQILQARRAVHLDGRRDPRPARSPRARAAAGPADTGLLAAELIEPGGTLISSDVVDEMVGQARARAAELGITNVEFRTIDAEWIDLPTADLDGVLGRWAYMLFADPATALRERAATCVAAGASRWGPGRDPGGEPVGLGAGGGADRPGGGRAARSRRAGISRSATRSASAAARGHGL